MLEKIKKFVVRNFLERNNMSVGIHEDKVVLQFEKSSKEAYFTKEQALELIVVISQKVSMIEQAEQAGK